MRASTYLLAAMVTFSPLPAVAQPLANPGDRVRVHSRDGTVSVGVVTAVRPESILVSPPCGPSRRGTTTPCIDSQEVIVHFAETEGLERSLGRHRRFGRNFGRTVGVSAAVFGLGFAIGWSPCTGGFFGCGIYPDSRAEAFIWGVAGGAFVGLPLGVIIGLLEFEQWEALSVPGTESPMISIRPIVGKQLGVVGSVPLGGG